MKKLLLLALGTVLSFPVLARDFNYEYEGTTITYTVVDENAKTCSTKAGSEKGIPGNRASGDIIIPAIAKDGESEFKVIAVGDVGFRYNKNLTSVKFPDTVESIGASAFEECSGLTSLDFPKSLTSIGNSSFKYCSGLTSLDLPRSLTSIGQYAFSGCISLEKVNFANPADGNQNQGLAINSYAFNKCNALTSISLPPYLNFLGNDIFSDCSNLKDIHISDLAAWCNVTFESNFASLFTENRNFYLNGELITDLVIPDGVEKINDYCFLNFSAITSLTIPNSVKTIGVKAFSGCYGISTLILPDSVISIENAAFSGCSGISELELPNSLESINDSSFSGCSGLSSIVISNSVTSIGDSAFSGCSNLTSLEIPNSVKKIGEYAFSSCKNLVSIKLPESIESIEDCLFYCCSNLESIIIPESVKCTTVRDSVLKPACISFNFAVKNELWTKWNYTSRFSHPSASCVQKGNSLRHSMPTVGLMEYFNARWHKCSKGSINVSGHCRVTPAQEISAVRSTRSLNVFVRKDANQVLSRHIAFSMV